MIGSGRGPAPPRPPVWARVAGLAAGPAMGLHRRSWGVWPATWVAISGRGATTGPVAGRGGGGR
jgi:hypothetical protein